jgi:hypothetical protein
MKKLVPAALSVAALALPSAAGATAPGQAIKSACGAPFGQLVSSAEPGFQLGQHARGGAAAFADPAILAAHGCGG